MANTGGAYTWSKTQANNASADNTVNYAEGQAPSSINDSARNAMASVAKYRDDISGAIVTSGTSAAYIVASNQQFDTLANFHGQVIAFTPHVTNGAGPITMTVDAFANLPVRTSPGKELLAGVLIQGTPYTATYNNTDGSLYLHGFYGASPYLVPLGTGMDYWLSTAPNSSFAFPIGQAISRTTYATLFAGMGTTYGVGDGSTTFNLPDKTGRVSAMKEASAARLTSTHFGGNSTVLGAVGGLESQTLSLGQLPAGITSAGSATVSVALPGGSARFPYSSNGDLLAFSAAGSGAFVSQYSAANNWALANGMSGSGSASVASNNTGGLAHPNVQPTIVCNYIIRII